MFWGSDRMAKQLLEPINDLHPDKEFVHQFPWKITVSFLLSVVCVIASCFVEWRWMQYTSLALSLISELTTLLLVFEMRRRRPFFAARQAAAFDRYDDYLCKLSEEEEE